MEGVLGLPRHMQGESVKRWTNDDVLSRYSSKVDLSVAWLPRKWKTILHSGKCPIGRYTLLYDPIDGSSNTDTNLSLGSIHSPTGREWYGWSRLIYSKMGANKSRLGTFMVPACWFILLVRSSFTLDPSGEFILSEENIQIPNHGSIYSQWGQPGWINPNTSAMSTAQKAIPLAIVELWLATSIEF